MISQIDIGSYRKLQNISFNDLKRINIFAGSNNSGKTSVLESIVMMGIYDNVNLIMNTLFSRYNGLSIDMIKSMFDNSNEEPLICLNAKFTDKEEIHTHITYNTEKIINDINQLSDVMLLSFNYDYDNTLNKFKNEFLIKIEEGKEALHIGLSSEKMHDNIELPCRFISFSRIENYNQMIHSVEELLNKNQREELIQVLQLFDESIINFEILGKSRAIKLFKRDTEKSLYLNDYGNGMYKAFFIAASALLCENGILLVDEIETGVHYKALVGFVDYLTKLCLNKNIQLFFTTHSIETIDSVLENDNVDLDDISLYHLKNTKEKISVRRYSGNKMLSLRQEIGFDMR